MAAFIPNSKSFVCQEEIERYKGDLKKSKKRYIDHVSANLSFARIAC